jgi:5-formyltetrahydrofolate cyclo-ligase
METKQHIRKQVFALRRACSDAEVEEKSRQITERILALPKFQNAERILAYADYNHEVRTCYLIEKAWQLGKTVAVPKVVGDEMVFHILTDFNQLQSGYFHIPEPVGGEIVSWDEALMLMPGVAFDHKCNRVGYGGGFYDRFLEKHPDILRLALAFEFQMFPEVPTEPTDIRPHLIVTESEILRDSCTK